MILEAAFLTEPQIQAYVDGTLSRRETEIVEQFLQSNPAHEKIIERYRRQKQELLNLYRGDPNDEIFTAVEDWIVSACGDVAD